MSTNSVFTTTQFVLGRNSDKELWKLDTFVKADMDYLYPYICMTRRYKQCIPYIGNEHLLRTTKSPSHKNTSVVIDFNIAGTVKITHK